MKNVYVLLALALLAAGMATLWYQTNSTPLEAAPEPEAAAEPTNRRVIVKATPRPARRLGSYQAPERSMHTDDEPEPLWETQIDQVLRAEADEAQTARTLITMLPNMPEEGQIEAAHHISNLLDDNDYASLKPTLLNTQMPEEVLSVLFTDLMNRGDEVKLRAFLDVARIPNHPYQEEALSDLQIYLDEDYGIDWNRWSEAVERYLQDNRDDAAS